METTHVIQAANIVITEEIAQTATPPIAFLWKPLQKELYLTYVCVCVGGGAQCKITRIDTEWLHFYSWQIYLQIEKSLKLNIRKIVISEKNLNHLVPEKESFYCS